MSTTREKVAMLTGAVAKLETDLAAAEANVKAMQEDYDREALSRLASGNAQAASKARKAIADAQGELDDLRLGLDQTRAYLSQAKNEAAREAEAAAWKVAEAAAEEFIQGTARLESATDAFVDAFLAVAPIADQLLRLAPVRNVDLQRALVEHQRAFDVQLRLFAKGGARLGKIGRPTIMPPDLLHKQCDLVGMAKTIVKELLSPRDPSKTKTTGDAA